MRVLDPDFRVSVCSAGTARGFRFPSAVDFDFAQIPVVSGRRPLVKGCFEAVVNVPGAVVSTAG